MGRSRVPAALLVLLVGAGAACAAETAQPDRADEGGTEDPSAPTVDEGDGTGFLTVSDAAGSGMEALLDARAQTVEVELRVIASGCVNLVIDGTSHVPLWPARTVVRQVPGNPSSYEVVLDNGTTLAGEVDGEISTFSAEAIVGTASPDPVPGGKVASLRSFCGPSSPFVAIPDAGTIKTTSGAAS